MSFNQGHALVIGVGSYQHIPGSNVPIAVKDAQAVVQILKDEKYCGYLDRQIDIIVNSEATHSGTLEALDRLAQRAGEKDTVFLFYCGHGALGTDGNYYLVSHDAKVDSGRVVPGSGVSEAELVQKLGALKARRALLIFNTCHSGNISPALAPGESEIESLGLSENAASALLATGSGRIIVTACREEQKSYLGPGPLTIFTQALVDGLRGKGVGNNAGYISAYSLYEYVFMTVTEKAGDLKVTQEPELTVIKGVGPLAVSLFKGASLLGEFDESQPVPDTPAVRQVKPESAQRSYQQIIKVRDGAVAIGVNAKAVGKGGILIEGNVGGDVLGPGAKKSGK